MPAWVRRAMTSATTASVGLITRDYDGLFFPARSYCLRLKTTGSSLVRIFTLAVCLSASQGWAAATKPWVILTNCQYLANAEGDGDSFRVRGGTNEFLLRLYFVDAPETNLRYPERTREQSEYFGV